MEYKYIKYVAVAVLLYSLIFFILSTAFKNYYLNKGMLFKLSLLFTVIVMILLHIFEKQIKDETNIEIRNFVETFENTEETTEPPAVTEEVTAEANEDTLEQVMEDTPTNGYAPQLETTSKYSTDADFQEIMDEAERYRTLYEKEQDKNADTERVLRNYLAHTDYDGELDDSLEDIQNKINGVTDEPDTKEENPFILINQTNWDEYKHPFSMGCKKPIVALDMGYMDVTEMYGPDATKTGMKKKTNGIKTITIDKTQKATDGKTAAIAGTAAKK